MFESLVSSRIRRALLEYIVTHPDGRFYLRGLAKELSLSVSPLRRELLRLEGAGVLKADREGNLRFYTVTQTHPLFVQLKQTASSGQTAAVPAAESPAVAVATPEECATSEAVAEEPSEPMVVSAPRAQWPMILGGTSLVILACAIAGIAGYLMMQNQQLVGLTSTAVTAVHPQATSMTPPAAAESKPAVATPAASSESVFQVADQPASAPQARTGEMRSSRWRLMPGRIGGLSSGEAAH